MSDHEVINIGLRQVWGGEQPFGLAVPDRRRHLYLIGQTGVGKTSLLRHLILQDVEANRGLAVLDPHGDLANELLDYIPPRRTNDIVYFNPADRDHPVGFNLLGGVPVESRHLVASGIVGAFKSIWRDSWGPRLEYILYASVAALLECQNVTILGVQRLLVDDAYRRWVLKQVRDPLVRSFWLDEFEAYDPKFRREAIAPIQNKIGQLLMVGRVRNIFGQVRSRFDPRFMMDNRRILIANLSKGLLGEDKANLLGSLLINAFQLAALSRADVPETEREDFHVYIDEFHNFTTDTFASILSEARKYRLCLTLSHQYVPQLVESVRDAVFGNVGTVVAFRVGQTDARVLADLFGPAWPPTRFSDLANQEVIVKLLRDGSYGDPFLGRTTQSEARRHGRSEMIIRQSREKYATKRLIVEGKINRWMKNAN